MVAGDTRVPSELRERIAHAVQVSRYRPLEAIQARLGRPLRLAIVLKTYPGDDPEANRFYVPVMSAIALSCAEYGAEIVQARMSVDDLYEVTELPSAVLDGSCDAAFFIGAQINAPAAEQIGAACPIVLVDGYSPGEIVDSVVTDNIAGGTMAVEHLIAAGHREIALLGTEPVCYPSMQDRRTGYAETLAKHGLQPHFVDTGYSFSGMVSLLGLDYARRNPAVTAVFGANDAIMVEFMQLAREAGYRIPADLSLVGFDDIDLAGLVMPALTTLAIDKRLMGRAGFALLAHRLEVPTEDPIQIVLTPRLIERETVGPPRAR